MFKKLNEKRKREKLQNMFELVRNSSSIDEVKRRIENISNRDISKIEQRTIFQAKSEDWFYYRKGVITSTLVKRIISFCEKGKPLDDRLNNAISKFGQRNVNYPAIVYGREMESFAITDFFNDFRKKHYSAKIQNVGLKIDRHLKFFGGSADGVLHCKCQNCVNDFILEVKAPYRLKDQSVVEGWRILEYLTEDMQLNTNHSYYYQIQCYMGLYGYKQGFFVVWSKKDYISIIVDFDEALYGKICEFVQVYFYEHYVKSLL